MGEIVEVRGEVRLEHMVTNVDHVTVEETNKVLPANIEDFVTSMIVLMDLGAACLEEIRDIFFTEECLSYLEASATSECSKDVTVTNNCISDDSVVIAEHLMSDLMQRMDFTGADLSIIDINTRPKEESVHLLNLFAGAEDALVTPVVLEIIAADPLRSSLVGIR